MINIILHDESQTRTNLLPLTFTRPTGDLRCGILTIAKKWETMLDASVSYATEEYLSELFPAYHTSESINIAGHIIPSPAMAEAVKKLKQGEVLMLENEPVAWLSCTTDIASATQLPCPEPIGSLHYTHNIFTLNHAALQADFQLLTAGKKSCEPHESCTVIGPKENLFIAPGASVLGCSLNTTAGPIYIGQHAQVMEGSHLRGPVAVCEHAIVNMGTRIYGATTIGPYCKVGGEINNVVMQAYSNKAHDGFLGNAVIGEWCNLGAGCVASNLKNDYTEIKLWNYGANRFLRTGLQFCGLIMGDHSKAGINTMFNTATTIGVGVNIHGTGFPRNFVPSFSEGSPGAGFGDVSLSKFFTTAEKVMARRDIKFTEAHQRLYTTIHNLTEQYK
ncbi:MAG: glucose-1-phosphate thymidylyltransferase [Paramuribaculum sp.]|nr:glucose-1-phosphate thymidylyltransferase [Paramuribaculum sp.]